MINYEAMDKYLSLRTYFMSLSGKLEKVMKKDKDIEHSVMDVWEKLNELEKSLIGDKCPECNSDLIKCSDDDGQFYLCEKCGETYGKEEVE